MKILHLSPYVPVPPNFGGALRVYHLLKGLSRSNEVTFLTFGYENQKPALEENFGSFLKAIHIVQPTWAWNYRRLAQFYSLFTPNSFFSLFTKSDEMQRLINKILSEDNFDVIQMEFPIMGIFDFESDAVKILDEHNVEYDNFYGMWKHAKTPIRRLHYMSEYKKSYKEEIASCKKMDAIFVVSNRDKQILDKEVPSIPKYLVPNGVDTLYFKPSGEVPEPYSLVFTGMMAYVPNYDGMLYFLDEIFPLVLKKIPQAKIYIVGNRPPKELERRASGNVIITGYVDDVRPYVRRASLYVVPLRMGGGTRLKVLEALAMKKPVVTTSVGCEGIDVSDNESVIIRNNPAEFAKSIIEVLKNRDMQKSLGEKGYETINSVYDWNVVSRRLEGSLKSVLLNQKRKKVNTREVNVSW